MNQTIRARIEQIKRGGIPEGYEKTPFGIFPCDWDKSTLKKLGKFAKGKGIPGKEMKNEGIPCVSYGDIYMKYNYHFNQAKSLLTEPQRMKVFKSVEILCCLQGQGKLRKK